MSVLRAVRTSYKTKVNCPLSSFGCLDLICSLCSKPPYRAMNTTTTTTSSSSRGPRVTAELCTCPAGQCKSAVIRWCVGVQAERRPDSRTGDAWRGVATFWSVCTCTALGSTVLLPTSIFQSFCFVFEEEGVGPAEPEPHWREQPSISNKPNLHLPTKPFSSQISNSVTPPILPTSLPPSLQPQPLAASADSKTHGAACHTRQVGSGWRKLGMTCRPDLLTSGETALHLRSMTALPGGGTRTGVQLEQYLRQQEKILSQLDKINQK